MIKVSLTQLHASYPDSSSKALHMFVIISEIILTYLEADSPYSVALSLRLKQIQKCIFLVSL